MPGEQNTIQSLTHEIHTFDFLIQRMCRSVLHLWIIFPSFLFAKSELAGDFAYADTWLTEVNGGYLNATTTLEGGAEAYESILDDFYDQLTNITKNVPFMTAPGNHEANCVDTTYSSCSQTFLSSPPPLPPVPNCLQSCKPIIYSTPKMRHTLSISAFELIEEVKRFLVD